MTTETLTTYIPNSIFPLEARGEWLEDSRTGRFSRFSTEPEESTWVCNECGAEDADPWEDGCTECGAEADAY
jgi:rubrerythrin